MLLVEVEQGATNIARGHQMVARLIPVGTGERELGFGGYQLPDTFFDELPEEELSAREAGAPARVTCPRPQPAASGTNGVGWAA
ncbi:hypothetical protein [Actinomyces viscosus]|uniref:Uncharacterized protein n=1 Tax=Actinomyces viscosus TaxID=1656 RepID=A0A448PM81_ACTVI|nr:hypothetical protein [Actinomyces viscosus]VEI17088.1 Uncharacterised protein [Actinomyces viscosus]